MQTIVAATTRSRRKATPPKTSSRLNSHQTCSNKNKGRYITIYLSNSLASHYEDQATMFKTTVGKLIKERVEAQPLSFYDKMKKFIGSAEGLPEDLSTNPAYLEDMGKDSIPAITKR
ncbi:MAG: hypothetical protein K2W99_04180 [Chthoniobacterales bacterium]|nr:hypothetical protein [Chthoniobacterales bacterium]